MRALRRRPEDSFLSGLSLPEAVFTEMPRKLDWVYVLRELKKERTACLFYRNVCQRGINIPREVLSKLRELHLSVASKNVVFLSQARAVAAALAKREIPCMPLKGALLTKFIYEDVGLRDMADIDLLVKQGDLNKADTVLRGLGYASEDILIAHPNGHANPYRNSALYFFPDKPLYAPVHLHWHLVNASLPLFMYRINIDELWREAREADFDGTSVAVMAPHHLLLHLAEHTLKHSFDALIQSVDMLHLLHLYRDSKIGNPYKKIFPSLDWDEVVRTARRWGLERTLSYNLFFISEVLGVSGHPPVSLRNCRFGFEGRYFVRSLERNNRWTGLSFLGYLSLSGRMMDKLRFILRTLFPPGRDLHTFGKRAVPLSYVRRTGKALRLLGRCLAG